MIIIYNTEHPQMVVGVDRWLPASGKEPMAETSLHVLNKLILADLDLFLHLSVLLPFSFHKAHICLTNFW